MSSPTKQLPEPLDARVLKHLARNTPPEKPTSHGCAYFDGAPWDICYACEYERSPATYQAKIQRSTNIEYISAAFRDTRVGQVAAAWPSRSDDLIASIVGELQKSRAERTYTDEQLADTTLAAEPGSLLAGLRALLAAA